MRWTRPLAPGLAVAALAAAGCSDRVSRSFVSGPGVGAYAISGQVRISGAMFSETNEPMGNRILRDVSGVRVRLRRPDGSTDSVLTRGGRYEFRVDDPGLYRASCWAVAPDTVATTDVVVAGADAQFPDTLALGPAGALATYPSPFAAASGVGLEITVSSPQRVEFAILDVSGAPVWGYASDQAAGLTHVHWVGIDNDGNRLPNGSYWAVVRANGGVHYNLVFME